jgi:hypothetical protein
LKHLPHLGNRGNRTRRIEITIGTWTDFTILVKLTRNCRQLPEYKVVQISDSDSFQLWDSMVGKLTEVEAKVMAVKPGWSLMKNSKGLFTGRVKCRGKSILRILEIFLLPEHLETGRIARDPLPASVL